VIFIGVGEASACPATACVAFPAAESDVLSRTMLRSVCLTANMARRSDDAKKNERMPFSRQKSQLNLNQRKNDGGGEQAYYSFMIRDKWWVAIDLVVDLYSSSAVSFCETFTGNLSLLLYAPHSNSLTRCACHTCRCPSYDTFVDYRPRAVCSL
jgi:hypothetical protein